MNDNDRVRPAELQLIQGFVTRYPDRAESFRTNMRQHLRLGTMRIQTRKHLRCHAQVLAWSMPLMCTGVAALSVLGVLAVVQNAIAGSTLRGVTGVLMLILAGMVAGLLHALEATTGKFVHTAQPWELNKGWQFVLSEDYKKSYRTASAEFRSMHRHDVDRLI